MARRPLTGLSKRAPAHSTEPDPTDHDTHDDGGDARSRRRIRPVGRGLPGSRALVGGLLVTVAVVAVFAAYAGADAAPTQRAVTVRVAVPAGHTLTADDLIDVAVELPAGAAGGTYSSIAAVEGAVTLAPLLADDLVLRSAVLPAGVSADRHEFSFPVDRERAVDGDLRPGESVEILATYGSGADSYTAVLARRASVIAVQTAGRGTLGSGGLVLTVGLERADEVLDLAHAAQVAELTVVRATRAGEDTATRDRTGAPGRPPTGATTGSAS